MTNAQAVAAWLEDKKIKHAFGIIGGGNAPLWDAIARRGYTKLVCVHHEQAAAQAATYYYRVCEKLALVLVTTGAGSTNAITGVMAAWMDSIPLLVISGNEASHFYDDPGRGFGFQGYKSAKVASHFTKFSASAVLTPLDLTILEHAYRVALAKRQGPVWLDFPKDLQNAMA
jgi:acetolactate synthase I/II/III large subunit